MGRADNIRVTPISKMLDETGMDGGKTNLEG
jgi:hypothetical protein